MNGLWSSCFEAVAEENMGRLGANLRYSKPIIWKEKEARKQNISRCTGSLRQRRAGHAHEGGDFEPANRKNMTLRSRKFWIHTKTKDKITTWVFWIIKCRAYLKKEEGGRTQNIKRSLQILRQRRADHAHLGRNLEPVNRKNMNRLTLRVWSQHPERTCHRHIRLWSNW